MCLNNSAEKAMLPCFFWAGVDACPSPTEMQYAVGGISDRFSIPERLVFVHWAQAIAEAGVVDRKGCQANEKGLKMSAV